MDDKTDIAGLIHRGGVYYNIKGANPEEIFRSAVKSITLPEYITAEALTAAVIQREEMASTAFGHGIAMPHPRNPCMVSPDDERICVFFLDRPVDFEAIDGEKVYVLFVVLSAGIASHLRILSECCYLFQQESFRQKLADKPDAVVLEKLIADMQRQVL